MRRYRAVVAPSTGAGSTTLPVASIYSGSATVGLILKSVEIKNTTATAARGVLQKLTSRGTPGAAVTEAEFVDANANNVAEAFNTHTVAPTLGAIVESWSVEGGAGKSDVIDLSYLDPDPEADVSERGLYIPPGTANGAGLIVIGTGQVLDVTFDFMEA